MADRNPVHEHLAAGLAEGVRRLADANPGKGATDELRQAFQGMSQAIGALVPQAETAYQEAARIVGDASMYPEGRERRLNEHLTDAQTNYTEAVHRAEAAAELYEAQLAVDAIGTVSRAREAIARADAHDVLEVARSLSDVIAAMQSLATDADDDVVALVAGDWGRRYLVARGAEPSTHAAIRTAAIARNARASNDPARSTAAQTWLRTRNLRGALTANAAAARGILAAATDVRAHSTAAA